VRGILVGLLAIAACYAPAIATGAPCADNGPCPEGQSCSAGFCVVPGPPPDAAGDAVTIADRDGDGVEDTTDNCPDDKNADQGNEDGDRFGDACDPCPQLVDTAIADKDGDHIGDACDPNATAADTGWLFEGFHSGLPDWPGSLGWQATSDSLQVAAPGDPAPASEYLVLPLSRQGRMTFDNYSTAMSVTVQQVSSGTDHEVGIEYFDDNTKQGLSCELAEINGARILWLVDDLTLDKKVPFTWMNGMTYVLRLVRHGMSYTCDVVGPGSPAPASGTSPLVPRTGADTDVFAYGVTVRFGSVSVVGPPP
jgi:hypothetical protein